MTRRVLLVSSFAKHGVVSNQQKADGHMSLCNVSLRHLCTGNTVITLFKMGSCFFGNEKRQYGTTVLESGFNTDGEIVILT